MTITPDLLAAYLKCPTKCWLRHTGESASGNVYAEWVRDRDEAARVEGVKRLIADAPEGSVALAPRPESLKMATWRLATDVIIRTENRETQIAAVERVPSEVRGKSAQFVPVRFVWRNKLHRDDKLLLAFDSLALAETLGRDVPTGKIIHGDDHATAKIKLPAFVNEVRKLVEKAVAVLASPSPPDLVLNRHCAECEFQTRCRKIAIEKDDLSLLGGMSEKERQKLRSKGIFTVTQLSYTFRPRRTPKRAKNPAKPRYHALQALAIRENTVYIHGTPILPQPKARVFLDIEGLPDRDFYYLIGLSIVSEGRETFQSYWADTPADEAALFAQFVETVSLLEDFRVFHFGDYDVVALKRKRPLLSEIHRQKLDAILGKCTNVLSALYPHVYFPTHSNGLKDIGKFVGPDNSSGGPTGLHSVVWRHDWEASRELTLRAKLIEYNRTDCMLLTDVCDFLVRETSVDGSRAEGTVVRRTQQAIVDRPYWRLFSAKKYALEELGQINKRAYFDYQREKVLLRTHRHFKALNNRRRKLKRTNIRPNETISIELKLCPKCGSRKIRQIREMSHILLDVKFTRSGIKKWVKNERSYR
jgi:predicted RecB family nuclease